jgi:K+-sensing histidine kinase KdpD
MLKQILLNIATNAIKYTQAGNVVFRIRTDAKRLFIEVEDTGDGISQEEMASIFEPFKQVGGASASTGHGLGLAIVKQYIDALDGTIEVASELNKGSTFFIELPYGECSSEEQHRLTKTRLTQSIVSVAESSQKINILIAEDNENNIHLLKKILEILPCEIKVAKNGQEAIELFQEWEVDLLLMDNRMPIMDGIEAIEKIKKRNKKGYFCLN